MARAPARHAGGHWFKSSTAHYYNLLRVKHLPFFPFLLITSSLADFGLIRQLYVTLVLREQSSAWAVFFGQKHIGHALRRFGLPLSQKVNRMSGQRDTPGLMVFDIKRRHIGCWFSVRNKKDILLKVKAIGNWVCFFIHT